MTLPTATLIPSARALLARRILGGAVVVGILADFLIRDVPWGVGLILWMLALATFVIVTVRQCGRTLSFESLSWLVVAVVCSGGLSWRDAMMLHDLDVLAMLAALVFLSMSIMQGPITSLAVARVRDLMQAGFNTALEVAGGVFPLLLRDVELHTIRGASFTDRRRRILKAIVLTFPIIVIFAALLSSADPIFGSFFVLPDVDLPLILSHIIVPGFFAWVVAGWSRRTFLANPDRVDTAETILDLPFSLSTTDVSVTLGAMNVLFIAFVGVQIGWLFGGEGLVSRTTGLSYAEYARRGFFELMWVAGLLLALLLGAQALIPKVEERTHRLFRRLALPLIVLLGAILFSAGARMNLYVHYYGISADRLLASAIMIWLALVFIWFAITILRSRPRSFAAGLVISGYAVLFIFNVINPDALVARSNLARGTTPHSSAGGTDVRYLATLGGDAVPALIDALITTAATIDSTAQADRCAAVVTLMERWSGPAHERISGHWAQWNVARARAFEAVDRRQAELVAGCPTLTPPAPTGKPE